jgi:hypothetical protein
MQTQSIDSMYKQFIALVDKYYEEDNNSLYSKLESIGVYQKLDNDEEHSYWYSDDIQYNDDEVGVDDIVDLPLIFTYTDGSYIPTVTYNEELLVKLINTLN